jgi:inner membrane protein
MVGRSHMEPITHFLTGACIGRAGLNRKTRYATLAAVLAAEAADMDVFWGLRGPVEELKHHRGITHTFVAVPVVAGVVVGLVWLLDVWVQRRRRRKLAAATPRVMDPGAPEPRIPQLVHWGWLSATALIASLSHLLLDWTNNYGLRPFFPFNPRWYAGSFMFIAEPLLWALFLLALIMPWLFGLVAGEIGERRKEFRGRGWAIFALTGMVLLWAWRWEEHWEASSLLEKTQVASASVTRMGIEPYPVNPFRWHVVLETPAFYQTAEVDTLTGVIDSDPQKDVQFKPPATAATEVAKRTPLGQVYLDWGTWAVVRDVGQVPVAAMAAPELVPGRTWTTVEFKDLRFDYSFIGNGRETGRSALRGWVYVVDGRDDAGEAMDGREQH